MKKRILITAILVALFTLTSYAVKKGYPHCGTPLDKNCNGIPDYKEEQTFEDQVF